MAAGPAHHNAPGEGEEGRGRACGGGLWAGNKLGELTHAWRRAAAVPTPTTAVTVNEPLYHKKVQPREKHNVSGRRAAAPSRAQAMPGPPGRRPVAAMPPPPRRGTTYPLQAAAGSEVRGRRRGRSWPGLGLWPRSIPTVTAVRRGGGRAGRRARGGRVGRARHGAREGRPGAPRPRLRL